MNVKLIKTKNDYNEALRKIENVLAKGVKKGTKEGDELEILLLLVEKYEDAHFPIDAPDPVEAIKFRMEQMDLKPRDLEAILGNKSLVSKILNRKRSLSLAMIRNLNKALHIPTEILIREYSPKVAFKTKKAKFSRI
jgi:HTH-type transcriptional regulator / antitoxin HigA